MGQADIKVFQEESQQDTEQENLITDNLTVQQLHDLLEIYLDKLGNDVIHCGIRFEESSITFPITALQAAIIEGEPVCFLELDMV